jgi:nitrogen-specific signal transduction histidine kinase
VSSMTVPPLGPPPYARLRDRVARQVDELRARGETELATALEQEMEAWSVEQREWDARLVELLRLHHDINNALVGVSGNAQLLMRDPVAQKPGVRERLEVVVREAQRIQGAAGRLRELKVLIQGGSGESRAA